MTVGATAHGPTTVIRPGKSTGWWGMFWLIATESVLFGLLLFTYVYFRSGASEWPPGGLPLPELQPTIIRSFLLVGSSIPMVLAERALEHKGNMEKTAVWILVVLFLAAVFVVGHIQEMAVLMEEITPQRTAYGSVFITIINFHIAHVLVGMIVLAFLLPHVLRGVFSKENHAMVKLGAYYWHFVDVIWVFVFFILYLSPHILKS